jgi:hypothetical protein
MSSEVASIENLKIGVNAVEETLKEFDSTFGDQIHRTQIASWVFHSTSARLREGQFAGVEPEIWWQIAEGVQIGVDHWVDTGVPYDWAVKVDE